MISPTDQSPLSFFLDAVTYTGIIVSLVCLMVTIVSYIGNKLVKAQLSEAHQETIFIII